MVIRTKLLPLWHLLSLQYTARLKIIIALEDLCLKSYTSILFESIIQIASIVIIFKLSKLMSRSSMKTAVVITGQNAV